MDFVNGFPLEPRYDKFDKFPEIGKVLPDFDERADGTLNFSLIAGKHARGDGNFQSDFQANLAETQRRAAEINFASIQPESKSFDLGSRSPQVGSGYDVNVGSGCELRQPNDFRTYQPLAPPAITNPMPMSPPEAQMQATARMFSF